MKYLFFDIECCDGTHICSFGYVIIDENFKIINKEDIVINPNCKFKLARSGFDPKIKLAYTEEYFKKQPKFNYFYEKIKNLLYSNQTTLLGHSVKSDLNYLKIACERYHLPLLNLSAYDTQDIYFQLENKKNCSLDNIMKDLKIEFSNLTEHKSCDDAEMSMLVIKELCNFLSISINEILMLCENSLVDIKEKNVNSQIKDALEKALKEKKLNITDF